MAIAIFPACSADSLEVVNDGPLQRGLRGEVCMIPCSSFERSERLLGTETEGGSMCPQRG